jgi:hypothetical protein
MHTHARQHAHAQYSRARDLIRQSGLILDGTIAKRLESFRLRLQVTGRGQPGRIADCPEALAMIMTAVLALRHEHAQCADVSTSAQNVQPYPQVDPPIS